MRAGCRPARGVYDSALEGESCDPTPPRAPSTGGAFSPRCPRWRWRPRLAAQSAAGAAQGARPEPAHADRLRPAAIAEVLPGPLRHADPGAPGRRRSSSASARARSSSPSSRRRRASVPASARSAWASRTFSIDRVVSVLGAARRHARRRGADGAAPAPMTVRVVPRPGHSSPAARRRPTSTWPTRAASCSSCTTWPTAAARARTAPTAARSRPSPPKGLLAVRDMSHFTVGVADQAEDRRRSTRRSFEAPHPGRSGRRAGATASAPACTS